MWLVLGVNIMGTQEMQSQTLTPNSRAVSKACIISPVSVGMYRVQEGSGIVGGGEVGVGEGVVMCLEEGGKTR